MSEAKPEAAPAVFRLKKLYVKDLSLENPNAPQSFFVKGEPKLDVQMTLGHRQVDPHHFEVGLTVTVTAGAGETQLFLVEVEHAGVFEIQNVPEEHLPTVLAVECPAVLFPYTRQVISQASADAGFLPVLLEPVNFLALYERARKEQEH